MSLLDPDLKKRVDKYDKIINEHKLRFYIKNNVCKSDY